MPELRSIVDQSAKRIKEELGEQDEWAAVAPESQQIKRRIHEAVDTIFAVLERKGDCRVFDQVEKGVIPLVFSLGRLFIAYFLTWRAEHSERELDRASSEGFWQGEMQPRLLGTFFGKVRYWRTYVRDRNGGGFYPLDAALALTADGFSMLVMGLVARLATLVPFDQVTALMLTFLL